MKPETLLAVISEWLNETPLPELIPRQSNPIQLENLSMIHAVVGPRRSGKTFYLFQIIKQLLLSKKWKRNDILFVDFEDYRLKGFKLADIDTLLAAFNQLTGKYPRFLFFDEIQYLPDWSRGLRSLHNRRMFKMLVSGSNSRLLSREIATELRGRYEDHLMLPFSFREYLRMHQIDQPEALLHTPARGKLQGKLNDYLVSGGYPEVVLRSPGRERHKLLQNYYETIFYKDLLDRHRIKTRSLLDRMMSYLLHTYSETFSLSAYEKVIKAVESGGSKRTLATYLAYLQEAFFIISNEKFSYSPKVRQVNPKKVYLMDTGFANLATQFSDNKGKLLENLVAIELFRRQQQMFYYKGTYECDFVLVEEKRPSEAIQVCWELTPKNLNREHVGLRNAMHDLNIKKGTLVTYQEGVQLEDKSVHVVPAFRWLLGQG